MQTMQKMLVLAGLIITLCAGEAQSGERLTTTDLRQLFPGHFEAVVKNSIIVSIEAMADGSLTGSFLGASDTGRWSIRSGRLCIMLNTWFKGHTNCTLIVEDAGWYLGTDVKFRPI